MARYVRAALAVAVVGLLSTTAACAPDDARVVPPGWQDERVGALRIAIPPGWERDPDPGEYWVNTWQLVEDGEVVADVGVEFDVLSNGPKAGLVVAHLLQTMPRVDGYEVVERSPDPLDVDADFARARYVYDGLDGTQMQGVLWALGEGREQPAAVQLTGDVDDELIEQIEASLSFDPS